VITRWAEVDRKIKAIQNNPTDVDFTNAMTKTKAEKNV
jgi:hypothetical protein